MEAEARNDLAGTRRALEAIGGPVLRATRRGALVLQTENARRMMRRVREELEPAAAEPAADAESAAAQP